MSRRPKWIERLVSARKDKIAPDVRKAVLRMGDRAVPLLREVLEDERRWKDDRMSVYPLVHAIVLLGEIGTADAAKALVAALAHAEPDTGLHHLTVESLRGSSLQTLRAARLPNGTAQDSTATPHGRDVLSDDERRNAIVAELTRPLLPPRLPKGFDPHGQPDWLVRFASHRDLLPEDLAREIMALGDRAVEPLRGVFAIPGLWAESGEAAEHSIDDTFQTLAAIGTDNAIDAMLEGLARTKPFTLARTLALVRCSDLRDRVVEPALARYHLADEDTKLALAELFGAVGRGDSRVEAALLDAFEISPGLVAEYIADFGGFPRALEVLVRAFDEAGVDDEISQHANEGLLRIAGAIDALGGRLSAKQRSKLRRAKVPRKAWETLAWPPTVEVDA